ncbi:MAG: hypothetical protein ABIG31_05725 [Candidatus Omnitrophota bacterium]
MKRQAQTLMISLWILAILTILAVGTGHRVSMALRMSRYHKDSLKALSLAKAALNLAIVEIEKDANDYDTLHEGWSDNESAFKAITLTKSPGEFATVSFLFFGEDKKPEVVYGLQDAERRVNINTASRQMLLALLEKPGAAAAEDIVDNILIWRGDMPDDNRIYDNLGYACKGSAFSKAEELNLVKDFTMQEYREIKNFITVYGGNLININTVSAKVLGIWTRGIAKKLGTDESFAGSVAEKILQLRKIKEYFKDKDEIDVPLTTAEETGIFNVLMNNITLQSDIFLIEVTGNSSKIKRKIEAVYSRKEKKILDWHES